jgi:hypothetical protein
MCAPREPGSDGILERGAARLKSVGHRSRGGVIVNGPRDRPHPAFAQSRVLAFSRDEQVSVGGKRRGVGGKGAALTNECGRRGEAG